MQDFGSVTCSSTTFPSPYLLCSQGVGLTTSSNSLEIAQLLVLPHVSPQIKIILY